MSRNKSFLVWLSAILPVFALLVCSSGVKAEESVEKMVNTLQKLYPNTTFNKVSRTPVTGVFEVVMGQNIAYVDQSGRYFLFGRLFDMQTQQDLSASTVSEANKVDASGLPLEDAIKTVRGKGSRVLFVFSDPDCPYCRQLERNLSELKDVTIYTFMYPLEGLHPEARAKSIAVWCAKDRQKAWEALMIQGTSPRPAECKNPVDRNISLGQRLNIQGTPTMVTPDGRRLSGAVNTKRIDEWLSSPPISKAGSQQ